MKFCDLSCEYARFPDKLSDGSYTCRTFIALYCEKLGRLVNKNGVCQAELEDVEKEEVE
ncbi:MAG: hypothetical protein ISS81_05540 [Candidatus Marinimicrobia bacterium]|nr:hypothetical protein [Candidatus Neomarinimicrobiota bacterium]